MSGGDVRQVSDNFGRAVTYPYAIRGLMSTAFASLTNGTKTDLLAGTTSIYSDLLQVSCANTSTGAVTVAIYDESTLVQTLSLPASDTIMINYPIPYPQSTTGVNWYADMDDVTTTTVDVSAIFVNNK